jgi:hypothetical protein
MLMRLNRETKKMIKKLCKRVAKKLETDECNLCIVCPAQANVKLDRSEKEKIELCFETEVDDTYADLITNDDREICYLLKTFMDNPNVEFMNRGDIV